MEFVPNFSEGFIEDAIKLIESFKLCNSIEFKAFAKKWKEMQFGHVFRGTASVGHIRENSEEFIRIAKVIMLIGEDLVSQIGGLYLIYGLHQRQPIIDHATIRFTLEEWSTFETFCGELKEKIYKDARMIIAKLYAENAILFVASDKDYSLHKGYQKHFKEVDLKAEILLHKKLHASTMPPPAAVSLFEPGGLIDIGKLLQQDYLKYRIGLNLGRKTFDYTKFLSREKLGITNCNVESPDRQQKKTKKSPSTNKNLKDGPISVKNGKGGPSSIKNGNGVSPKNVKGSPSSSKDINDGASTSKNLEEGPSISKDLKEGPTCSKYLNKGPSTSKNFKVGGPSTSKVLKEGPSCNKNLIEGLPCNKNLNEGPSTSKHLKKSPSSSKNLKEGPSCGKSLKGSPCNTKNIKGRSFSSKILKEGPSGNGKEQSRRDITFAEPNLELSGFWEEVAALMKSQPLTLPKLDDISPGKYWELDTMDPYGENWQEGASFSRKFDSVALEDDTSAMEQDDTTKDENESSPIMGETGI